VAVHSGSDLLRIALAFLRWGFVRTLTRQGASQNEAGDLWPCGALLDLGEFLDTNQSADAATHS
jgi:hypothetical protein